MPQAESRRDGERQPLLNQVRIDKIEVYPIIQMIRRDAIRFIDAPLPPDALSAPDIVYSLLIPLEDKYKAIQQSGNLSVVFCLLLNRAYFLRDRNIISSGLSRTRAALCEKLAIAALNFHASNMLELALVLTTSWPVYSGADPVVVTRAREEADDDLEERVGNAIEVAIISQAKNFIKTLPCQKVVDGIWSGKIVYQADSSRSILSDTYKRNPIHFYDPHKAPLLDHYRLKVPAVRSVLEYTNFVILFILFVFALEFNKPDRVDLTEAIFMIYALGFSLEKVAAMQEHGIKVYSKGTWNGFDLAFVTLYCTYSILRLYGVYHDRPWARHTGIDCLALIAILMFPRLAFVTLKNNLMVLALRAMIAQFVVLTLLAAFCFGGFLYALWTLSRNQAGYSVGQIAWWMLDLFFGLDASGFDNATHFHPVFGPFIMVTYACLSNTLLVTVLVSILSHTFSTISDDAAAEAMFRRAVSTIEGVKADSLFSYQPPINLVALCFMLPASYILTPRWFHKVNVFMIRLTSFPILLLIAFYERQAKQIGALTFGETVSAAAEKVLDALPRWLKRFSFFEGLAGSEADIDAIFELEEEFENESALDLTDAGPIPPVDFRHRRPSQPARPRGPSSGSISSSPSPLRGSSPSSPARKPESSSPAALSPPPLSNIALPRTRVNSILSMAQSAPSPLAQVFQPLMMHEAAAAAAAAAADSPAEDQKGGGGGGAEEGQNAPFPKMSSSPPAMSYGGPAVRRRLSSQQQQQQQQQQRHRRDGSLPQQAGLGLGLRRFPPAAISSPPQTSALFESPDEHDTDGLAADDDGAKTPVAEGGKGRPGSVVERRGGEGGRRGGGGGGGGPLETAGQIEEGGGGFGELEKRFDRVESRQKRIEDLLVHLTTSLRR